MHENPPNPTPTPESSNKIAESSEPDTALNQTSRKRNPFQNHCQRSHILQQCKSSRKCSFRIIPQPSKRDPPITSQDLAYRLRTQLVPAFPPSRIQPICQCISTATKPPRIPLVQYEVDDWLVWQRFWVRILQRYRQERHREGAWWKHVFVCGKEVQQRVLGVRTRGER